MSNRMRMVLGAATLLAAMAFGEAGAQIFIPGATNKFEDNSREAFFDVGTGNVGTFGVGDVVVGFVSIEQRTAPGGTTLFNNTVYAVFSQQVTAIAGDIVTFGTTTFNGLRMDQIATGAAASSMVALYTNPAGYGNLPGSTLPPNSVGGAAITMADYLAFISGGTFLLSAGIAQAGDFFQADLVGAAPSTAVIAVAPDSINFAAFAAGLSIIQNSTGLSFLDNILTNDFLGNFPFVQLAIVGGNVTGAETTTTQNFQDGSEFAGAPTQCPGACGFINNADFLVTPVAVPEPASMILFGIGLAGLGIYGRKRSRRKAE